MPTYEYRCRDCGEPLEAVQSFDDDPLTICPACGGSLRKVFGNIGITFKGAGFYKNDARSASSKKSDTSSSGDGSSSSSDGAGEKSSEKTSGDKKSPEKSSGDKPSSGSSPSKGSEPAAASA